MPETRESLRQLIRAKLRDHKFIVVSNREPYVHVRGDGRLDWMRPASGVTTALDPVMQASGGLWVAHGSGSADAEVTDQNDCVPVPPDRPTYRLKRVWLTKEQEEGYYYGFANSALWPLCHVAFRRPVFYREHWEAYREANAVFADRVAAEIGAERAFVFIQDYHFALLPQMLRQRCPRAVLAQFWHIPWPNPEVFSICPWKEEILDGMLGNDILGFQIRAHCLNFIGTVDQELEARSDRETTAVIYRGHTTKIRAFPISVDFEEVSRRAESPEIERLQVALRSKYRLPENCILGVGADRIDYTKGLLERFEALERFFERYPQYRGRLVFFQAGAPSRTRIEAYGRLVQDVDQRIAALNKKYGCADWQPVVYAREHLPLTTLLALYRMARFMIVSSLQDGMNLVAKEFVGAKVNCDGVLLLARFTGAARELDEALIINPYSPEEMADSVREAIEMDPVEMRRRMACLRERVRENNVFKWAADIIRKLSKLA